jgi:hypothetical protein
MSFVLLLLGLLSGGLICLLVVHTTLDAASLSINTLQQRNATKAQRVQELQQQVAGERSPSVIAREAAALGMRPLQAPTYINLRTHKIETARNAAVSLPGSSR